MRKKVYVNQWLLILLVVVTFASIILNIIQHQNQSGESPKLEGSFSTNSSGMGNNLVFDKDGHFCMYDQEEGLIEEGNYIQQDEMVYILNSVSNRQGSVLIVENGLYYVSLDSADPIDSKAITFYGKYSDTPVFIGEWADEWGHFPEKEYEIK